MLFLHPNQHTIKENSCSIKLPQLISAIADIFYFIYKTCTIIILHVSESNSQKDKEERIWKLLKEGYTYRDL